MIDYKEMYLKLFNGVEDAINILIKTQRECEEIYINSSENKTAEIKVVVQPKEKE